MIFRLEKVDARRSANAQACGSCGRALDPEWLLCPYCEAEIPGVTPSPEEQAREQRRREREAGRAASTTETDTVFEEEYFGEDEGAVLVEDDYAGEDVEIFAEEPPATADEPETNR